MGSLELNLNEEKPVTCLLKRRTTSTFWWGAKIEDWLSYTKATFGGTGFPLCQTNSAHLASVRFGLTWGIMSIGRQNCFQFGWFGLKVTAFEWQNILGSIWEIWCLPIPNSHIQKKDSQWALLRFIDSHIFQEIWENCRPNLNIPISKKNIPVGPWTRPAGFSEQPTLSCKNSLKTVSPAHPENAMETEFAWIRSLVTMIHCEAITSVWSIVASCSGAVLLIPGVLRWCGIKQESTQSVVARRKLQLPHWDYPPPDLTKTLSYFPNHRRAQEFYPVLACATQSKTHVTFQVTRNKAMANIVKQVK